MFCWQLQHCIQTHSCSCRFVSLAVISLESLTYSDQCLLLGSLQCNCLHLQVVAGMPDNIQEVLRVKVAHFDPVTLTLVGQGVYPALLLTLPRVRNEDYDQALIEAQDSLRAAQLKPQPVPRFAIQAVIYHVLRVPAKAAAYTFSSPCTESCQSCNSSPFWVGSMLATVQVNEQKST